MMKTKMTMLTKKRRGKIRSKVNNSLMLGVIVIEFNTF